MAERLRAADGFVAALGMCVLFALLRTAQAPDELFVAWTAAASLLAIVSPLAALTLLAALGPFTQAQSDTGQPTAMPFLLGALGIGLLARLGLERDWRAWLPTRGLLAIALGSAVVVFAGTLLGVGHTALSFGQERGLAAAQAWVVGIGGGITVFFGAVYLAHRGERRPLLVAIVTLTLAASLGLLDQVSHGGVTGSALGWLLRDYDQYRLTGVIPAPNASATMFAAGAAVALAAALLGSHPRPRIYGFVAAVPLAAAALLTQSRSGWIALGVVLIVVAWAWNRRAALSALAAVAVVAFAVAALGLVREVPEIHDVARLEAWRAALQMWIAEPLLGHGFRSFEWLHAEYGSLTLDAPHNEWLRLFAEEGTLVGVAGVAFALALPLAIVVNRRPSWPVAGAAAAAAALIVLAAFNNPLLYVQVVTPAFLILGYGVGSAMTAAGSRADVRSAAAASVTPASGQ